MAGRRNVTEKQKKNLIPLNERSEEERKRISQMGVEARKNKKREQMQAQKTMRELLSMRVSNRKIKALLEELGFTGELTNEMALMVALFKKGLTGDVNAIREVVDMQDKLDAVESGKEIAGKNITINLVPQGKTHIEPNVETEEQDIWNEDDEVWEEQDELDDWGEDDVYNP